MTRAQAAYRLVRRRCTAGRCPTSSTSVPPPGPLLLKQFGPLVGAGLLGLLIGWLLGRRR